jgi:hypothetical protein
LFSFIEPLNRHPYRAFIVSHLPLAFNHDYIRWTKLPRRLEGTGFVTGVSGVEFRFVLLHEQSIFLGDWNFSGTGKPINYLGASLDQRCVLAGIQLVEF